MLVNIQVLKSAKGEKSSNTNTKMYNSLYNNNLIGFVIEGEHFYLI
jgi:hypothetical protein